MTDALPTDVQFDSWLQSPPPGAYWDLQNTLHWTGKVTASNSVTFTFLASQTADYGQAVANTAEFTHAGTYGSDSATFYVKRPPVLTITKKANPWEDVVHEQPVTYTLVLINQGPSVAASVALSDPLPAETVFAGWHGDNHGATLVSGEIRWQGTLTPVEVLTFTFVVSQTAGYGQTVTNTAWLSHVTGVKNAKATFTVEPSPFLDIDKLVEPNTNVGASDPVTYTIVVSNKGTSDAQNLVMTDTLHALTTFAGWIGPSQGATVSGTEIAWTGTVTASDAVTFTFLVTHTAGFGQTVPNTAHFRHREDQGEATAAFRVVPLAQLQINKTVTPAVEVQAGSPVTYTIIVKNVSQQDAFGVLVSDMLPTNTTFARWVDSPANAVASTQQVSWTGMITSNQAISLAFVINQYAGYLEQVTNTATFLLFDHAGKDEATFKVAARSTWDVYLPIVLKLNTGERPGPPSTPEPPEPPEDLPEGCPCGWFDGLGRMLDFELGEDY